MPKSRGMKGAGRRRGRAHSASGPRAPCEKAELRRPLAREGSRMFLRPTVIPKAL